MNNMKPHHVGYLVKDMNAAILEFENLGYRTISDVIYDCYRDIDICFLKSGDLCVELVKPVSEKSVVYDLAKKKGVTPYHICYTVDSIDETAEFLRTRGYIPMGEATPAPALGKMNAIFFYHRKVGIIELISDDMQMEN